MPAKYCLLYRLQYSNVLAPLLASAVRCHVSSVHSTYTRGMRIGIWSQDILDLRISWDIPRILKTYPGISVPLIGNRYVAAYHLLQYLLPTVESQAGLPATE